jgi:hypothetical protein
MVRVATTGNDSERVKTVPITRSARARPRSVMSLGPATMPDLERGDLLRVSAELQVTTDCRTPDPRCFAHPYEYSPRIEARLVAAPSARAARAAKTVPIAPPQRETCRQRRPQYEHHCVIVVRYAGFTVGRKRLPCAPQRCHVNLIVHAHHPLARDGDRLMIGGQKPSGKIPQDRGRINVVRYRNTGLLRFPVEATNRPPKRRLPLDFRRRVVISKRLDGLRAGEQLEVSAQMRTGISHLPYAVRTSARLILAESPRSTRQGGTVKSQAFGFGEITENNGSNCTKPDSPCVYRKVGVLEMRHDAVTFAGRPRPLYVNLVTVLGPKKLRAGRSDRVRLARASIHAIRIDPKFRG